MVLNSPDDEIEVINSPTEQIKNRNISKHDYSFLDSFKPVNFETTSELNETIENFQQFTLCKEDYERKYSIYHSLYKSLKENESQFKKLGYYLEESKSEDERKEINHIIEQVYQSRKEVIEIMKENYEHLHNTLKNLKAEIDRYIATCIET